MLCTYILKRYLYVDSDCPMQNQRASIWRRSLKLGVQHILMAESLQGIIMRKKVLCRQPTPHYFTIVMHKHKKIAACQSDM